MCEPLGVSVCMCVPVLDNEGTRTGKGKKISRPFTKFFGFKKKKSRNCPSVSFTPFPPTWSATCTHEHTDTRGRLGGVSPIYDDDNFKACYLRRWWCIHFTQMWWWINYFFPVSHMCAQWFRKAKNKNKKKRALYMPCISNRFVPGLIPFDFFSFSVIWCNVTLIEPSNVDETRGNVGVGSLFLWKNGRFFCSPTSVQLLSVI